MNELIRNPTKEEEADMKILAQKSRRKKTAEESFEETLGKELHKANLDKKPFAEQAARDDFKDYYEKEKKDNVRRNGYLKLDEIKPLKMDWSKYSDLKNFEEIDSGEKFDEDLSKRNPGCDVRVKFTKYKYKGYSNTYTVMENPSDAVKRARK